MIGLVLCCDPSERKAVLWCEDQGDLAFYAPSSQEENVIDRLEAGDLVEFDVQVEGAIRLARTVGLVRPSSHPDLPDRLRKSARNATRPRPIGNVISFPALAAQPSQRDCQASA